MITLIFNVLATVYAGVGLSALMFLAIIGSGDLAADAEIVKFSIYALLASLIFAVVARYWWVKLNVVKIPQDTVKTATEFRAESWESCVAGLFTLGVVIVAYLTPFRPILASVGLINLVYACLAVLIAGSFYWLVLLYVEQSQRFREAFGAASQIALRVLTIAVILSIAQYILQRYFMIDQWRLITVDANHQWIVFYLGLVFRDAFCLSLLSTTKGALNRLIIIVFWAVMIALTGFVAASL